MKLFARLFMDPHQRQLRQPEDYRAPLDPDQIKAEIKAKVSDSESRNLMLEQLSNYGPKKALTLAAVVNDGYNLREATKNTLDNTLHQYGVEATLGADFVTAFLIRRANALADGIQPGAAQSLGNAL